MVQLLIAVIYLAFISLGLPDAMLSAAWPSMYTELSMPISGAGVLSMIIAGFTILSSLLSDRMTKKLGTGLVTAISVGLTASALLGFSLARVLLPQYAFVLLCILAVPYGFGAGGVDAALNNYVALHYPARHMSWLHCMWGVGSMVGPLIMGRVLSGGHNWSRGYLVVSGVQVVLTAILLVSLPLWKKKAAERKIEFTDESKKPLPLRAVLRIPGAKSIFITFFAYCALEQTAMLWAGSYLTLQLGYPKELAATLASLVFAGLTFGRFVNGFLTIKMSDTALIRLGSGILLGGIVLLFIPVKAAALFGMALIGLGCAPIYPCIIHSTPARFGAENSQAMIGVQMATAYTGTLCMPPLFGLLADTISMSLLPPYLLLIAVLMMVTHEILIKRTK